MRRSLFGGAGVAVLALAIWAGAAPVAAGQGGGTPPELVLLNWSDYLDPDLAAEFERREGVRIREIYFESDDHRDDMMVESEGRGYDLVLVSGAQLGLYVKRGWVAPVSEEQVPNLRHVYPRWRRAFGAEGWGVPYFWGTLGIAYRRDLVPEPITRWRQLFEPPEALHGRIVMIDTSRDLIGMALKAAGHSANATDEVALADAEALLEAQRPYVKTYSYVSLYADSGLVSGEIVAAMMYSGDVLMVQEHEPAITYALPAEGGNLWVDYLIVMAGSENKALAFRFLDYLNEPEVAARQAQYVYYPTPNAAAEAFLPQAFLADPYIYPGAEALARSEVFEPLPPQAVRRRGAMLARIVH